MTDLKELLFENGFGYIWNNQGVRDVNLFLFNFQRRLKDIYIQNWQESINNSSKLLYYKQYKTSFTPAKYLDILTVKKYRHYVSCFRSSCHNLEIERGRHTNISRSDRLCKLCQDAVEDEYHFLLVCKVYDKLRIEHLPKKYICQPNYNKFNILMASENDHLIKSIAMYLFSAFKMRKDLLSALES